MRSPDHVLSSGELREMLGADVMPLFRLLFAQMAASCAALASALREAARGKRVSCNIHTPYSLLALSYAQGAVHQSACAQPALQSTL